MIDNSNTYQKTIVTYQKIIVDLMKEQKIMLSEILAIIEKLAETQMMFRRIFFLGLASWIVVLLAAWGLTEWLT